MSDPAIRSEYSVEAREWVVSTSSGDIAVIRKIRLDRGILIVYRCVTAEADTARRSLIGYYSTSDEAAAAGYNQWLAMAPSAWTAVSGGTARQPLPEPAPVEGVRPATRP
jgi:hypothetical protein